MPHINKDELRIQLKALRQTCETPSLYLSSYFNHLRKQIDQAICSVQIDQTDEENCVLLNLIWQRLIEKIDSFEIDCSGAQLDKTVAIERLDRIESILLNDKRKGNLEVVLDFLLFYLDTIQNEETRILSQLFQNKTIAFIHVPLESRKLFEWKLIIINDEFINMRSFHERRVNRKKNKSLDIELIKIVQMERKLDKQSYKSKDYFALGKLEVDNFSETKYLDDSQEQDDPYILDEWLDLKSLDKLFLYENAINEIKDNTFKHLPNLQMLNLKNNSLERIKYETFQGLEYLHTLNLSNNELTQIASDSFKSLINLHELDLSMNQISNIDENSFQSLTKLQVLLLTNNRISKISANLFKHLKNMLNLHLTWNQLVEIEAEAFSQLINLEELDLSETKLTKIDDKLFQGLVKLKKLSLRFNPIADLNENTFSDLTNLQELDLAGVEMKSLNNKIFNRLTNLEILSLGFNKITVINENSFDGLQKLKKLNLFRNPIKEIDVNAFKGLGSLKELCLADTEITRVDENLFNGLNELKWLDLGAKNLKTSELNIEIFKKLASLQELRLHSGTNEFRDFFVKLSMGKVQLRFDFVY